MVLRLPRLALGLSLLTLGAGVGLAQGLFALQAPSSPASSDRQGPQAPVPGDDSFPALLADLRTLPGSVGFLAQEFAPEPRALAALEPDRSLAVGSAFKLFVLGALLRRESDLSEVLRLEPRYRSLPSGVTQAWPEGAPVTAHTLATLMISISDNTATDHLLHRVGRERVESHLGRMGNTHAARNRPFLSTREMFVLKTHPDLLETWRASDEATRRALLKGEIATRPPIAEAYDTTHPTAIDEVEWFASAGDLSRALDWLRTEGGSDGLGILAANPGIPVPPGRFRYQGFKGGSETGVLCLAFLLEDLQGRWCTVTMAWNDPQGPVDAARFVSLASRALTLVQSP